MLSGDELRAMRKRDLVDDTAHHLALERPLGDVRRKIAGVLHREAHLPGVAPERARLGLQYLEPRQRHRLPREPSGKALHFALDVLRRRVAKYLELVPPRHLGPSELPMIGRITTAVAFALQCV